MVVYDQWLYTRVKQGQRSKAVEYTSNSQQFRRLKETHL